MQIVGHHTVGYDARDVTTGANNVRASRWPVSLERAAGKVRVCAANYWKDIGAGGKETNTGNPLTVSIALEANGVVLDSPNCSLANPAVLADGEGLFESLDFDAGAFGLTAFPEGAGTTPSFFVRMEAKVTAGQYIPRSGLYMSEAPASRLNQASGDASQLLATGVFTGTSGNAYGPLAILADPVSPVHSVIALTDSIGRGQADANPYPSASLAGGTIIGGLRNVGGLNFGLAHLGRHGATMAYLRSDGAKGRLLYKYGNIAIIALGANSLFGPADPIPAFEAGLVAEIQDLRAAGIAHIVVFTVTPRTISTNKFADQAGQSYQVNWDPVNVVGVINARIKTPGYYGHDEAFDINTYMGDGGNGLKWATNGTAYYPVTNADGAAGVITPGTGTISAATNSPTITGTGTSFTTQAAVGNFVYAYAAGATSTYYGRIAAIGSDTSITLEANAMAAASNGGFAIATAQSGTHPGPALFTLARAGFKTQAANWPASILNAQGSDPVVRRALRRNVRRDVLRSVRH